MSERSERILSHREQGKLLVLGASGYVGRNAIPLLLEQGYKVVAASRELDKLEALNWHGAELVSCDLLSGEGLEDALEGVSQVLYLVHSMSEGQGFTERDQIAALNLAIAANNAAVQHILYLGSQTASHTQSSHLLSREQTGRSLRSTGILVTELRAPIIIGPGSAPFELIRDVVNHLPGMLLPAQMQSRSAPIALDNLLHYLLFLLDDNELRGQTIDCAGPETMSYFALLERYAKHVKRRFAYLSVPYLPMAAIRATIALFSSAPAGIIRALLGGINHDMEANPQVIQHHCPQDLHSIEQAFSAALEQEQLQQDRLDWYQGNMIFRLHESSNAYYGEQIVVKHQAKVDADKLWRVLASMGGENGYFFLDILWRIRGWIDIVFGGKGTLRLRDNPDELFSGERLDNWLIKEASKNRRLLMQFLMRSPGAGCLEFKLEQQQEQCQLTIIAYWHPKGLWGRLYWVLFKPAHLLLFHGMSRKMLKMAQQR